MPSLTHKDLLGCELPVGRPVSQNPRDLPFDLLQELVKLITELDLASLALVNKDWNDIFTPILYKKNARGKDTALWYGIKENLRTTFINALAAGADTEKLEPHELHNRRTPLIDAIDKGNLERVKDLVKAGANVNNQGETPISPLHWLLCPTEKREKAGAWNAKRLDRPSLEIAKLFLEKHADPNAKDGQGKSVLQIAVSVNDAALVKELLKNGADVSAIDNFGWSPLCEALYRGDVTAKTIAGWLLKNGAGVYPPEQATPPLRVTIDAGARCRWGIDMLVDNGLDVDLPLEGGNTPLQYAIHCGQSYSAANLIRAGAETEPAEARRGPRTTLASPLHLAVEKGMYNVVHLILRWGSDPEMLRTFESLDHMVCPWEFYDFPQYSGYLQQRGLSPHVVKRKMMEAWQHGETKPPRVNRPGGFVPELPAGPLGQKKPKGPKKRKRKEPKKAKRERMRKPKSTEP